MVSAGERDTEAAMTKVRVRMVKNVEKAFEGDMDFSPWRSG
jgi:hypothetical protein